MNTIIHDSAMYERLNLYIHWNRYQTNKFLSLTLIPQLEGVPSQATRAKILKAKN